MNPEIWKKRFVWWWDQNPFCQPGSPCGLVLREGTGRIVGFNGLIPRDYEVDGSVVPGLISSTLFVRKQHRGAVLGLFAKINRLGRDFHMVDGTPSQRMQEILKRFHYEARRDCTEVYLPLAMRDWWRPTTWIAGVLRSVLPLEGRPLPEGKLVTSVEEIGAIPDRTSEEIVLKTTRESLRWSSEAGSNPPVFRGWIDRSGKLAAYVLIRQMKLPARVRYWRIVEWDRFVDDPDLVPRLVGHLIGHPEEVGLESGASLLAWAFLGEPPPPELRGFPRHKLKGRLHFTLPERFRGRRKCCRPNEGDRTLL